MSNKSTKEVMTDAVVDVLQTAVKTHENNQKAKKNDTKLMQETIKDLEAYVRDIVNPNFQHFDAEVYTSLGLHPPAEVKPQPEPSDSLSDTQSSESESISPRKRKPLPKVPEIDDADNEEAGTYVNVEEVYYDTRDSAEESPRMSKENSPVKGLPKSAPAVQQGWAAQRLTLPPQEPAPSPPPSKTSAKSAPSVASIHMMNLIAGANKIHPDKKTKAIVDALLSANDNLRLKIATPAEALKTIVDTIGTKKDIKGRKILVLTKEESNFLKEFMKIPSLQDVIKDRDSLGLLQNMAQSLPRNQRERVLGPLESAKNIAPTPKTK